MRKTKLVALVSGFTIGGIIVGRITKTPKKANKDVIFGNIRIDRSDKDALPNLFLELTEPLDKLEMSKTVMFNVVSKDYISH